MRCPKCRIDLTDRELPCLATDCFLKVGLYVSEAAKTNREGMFLVEMVRELERAREAFPKQEIRHMLVALGEEYGELCKDVLHCYFEGGKGKTAETIRAEAVQVAVMAMRIVFDTDRS